MTLRFIVLLLSACFAAIPLTAQKSSKTKAAKKLYEKGGEVKIWNAAQINTDKLEFSPAFYQNGIVFASSRNKNAGQDQKTGESYFELFYAQIDGMGSPMKPESFSLRINSRLHEGPVTFDRDGKTMYFTRNNQKKGLRQSDAKGVTRLKIYEAKKGFADWQGIKELPFNNDEYSCMHPTLSADGQLLYFASDMDGGYGGFDLYKVERGSGGQWGIPRNLGEDINTERDDAFPFIHSSGYLFFASDGYDGVGGLDLYMVDMAKKKGRQVTNLGAPFNSKKDDLGLILSPDGSIGYFTSARKGGAGKDDIYLFTANEGIWGRTKPATIEATIQVYDANNKEVIKDAGIRVFERTPDGLISSKDNDLYEAVLLPESEESDALTFRLVRKKEAALSKPDMYTNRKGKADYSFTGEKKYLILVTKDGYNTKEKGYSTIGNTGNNVITIPIRRVDCTELAGKVVDANGQSLKDAVLRIKNLSNGEEEVLIAEGGFSHCLPLGSDYLISAVKEQYIGESLTVSTKGKAGKKLEETVIRLRPLGGAKVETATVLKKGSVIVLDNLYYDYNQSFIQAGSTRELENLAEMMHQYPSLEIELGSHTDARGTTNYNLELSMRRAESARRYLIGKGLDENRIKAVGYGESRLRNACKDGVQCQEDEHQFNRRTEVTILKLTAPVEVRYRED